MKSSAQKYIFKNFREGGFASAATSAVEIAQELNIDTVFSHTRSGKKKRLFNYEAEDVEQVTSEERFKVNFFRQLVDRAIMSMQERFKLTHDVATVFSSLFSWSNLLHAHKENTLLTCCQNFQEKFGDIEPAAMAMELQRFVLILRENKNLNTAYDFLNYLLQSRFFEMYPNVFVALRIVLTYPVTVASDERSFSKLKLIKTFNKSTMADNRLSSMAMLSIESSYARFLDYDAVIKAFANEKVRSRPF